MDIRKHLSSKAKRRIARDAELHEVATYLERQAQVDGDSATEAVSMHKEVVIRHEIAAHLPTWPIMLIDCAYSSDEADEIIGDLSHQFRRRARLPRYRKVWVWCQTVRLLAQQVMKVMRTQARTGK